MKSPPCDAQARHCTVQETVQVHGHSMCRAVPLHAYVSCVVSSRDCPKSSLIMPGSRVRVPPLLFSFARGIVLGAADPDPGTVIDPRLPCATSRSLAEPKSTILIRSGHGETPPGKAQTMHCLVLNRRHDSQAAIRE